MLLRALSILTVLGVSHVLIVHCCHTAPEKVLKARAVMLRAVPGGSPTEPAGTVDFIQRGKETTVRGTVSGLTPGLHGMHVHQNGDLGNGCLAAGDHYNPFNMNHGSPTAAVRHVGDLGNIVAGPDGVANIYVVDSVIKLEGPQSVVGRALVIHAMRDDLGLGGSPLSLTTGDSGARVLCGLIVLI